MKLKRRLTALRSENGAAEFVEAVIIYPVVFLSIAFLIYVGLFLLQYTTAAAYAQKVGLLAAREIAYPGYINLVTNGTFSTTAVEADLNEEYSDSENIFAGHLNISFNTSEVDGKAYRYWSTNPLSGSETVFENILKDMIVQESIIGAKDEVSAEVTAENYFVVQYVTVKLTQQLIDFEILDFFGIEQPSVSVTVKAAANDTDEFIRNTDFVIDALEALANKLGIDVNGIKEKVNEAISTLGLN